MNLATMSGKILTSPTGSGESSWDDGVVHAEADGVVHAEAFFFLLFRLSDSLFFIISQSSRSVNFT